jgi:hypothetical protein
MKRNCQGSRLDCHGHMPYTVTNLHKFSFVRVLEGPRRPRQSSKQTLGATDDVDLDVFAGTYADPGYGTITLCTPSSTSHHCTQVLSAFAAITNSTRSSSIAQAASATLYASFPRVWCSYIRLVRSPSRDDGKGPAFVLVPTTLFPKGYGNDRSPFELAGDEDAQQGATVRFVVEDGKVKGMGVTGLVGEITERERTAKSVEEGSEVWFTRV